MDSHTLELLEFNKVRELLAGYGACSLGKELARQLEPLGEIDRIRAEVILVSEMVDALGQGLSPPFGGMHDVRLIVRRAAIGAQLTIDQLLEAADTLACAGNMYRYRMKLTERHGHLIELLAPIEDMGHIARSITGCIDSRGHVLDMASRELALVRQKLVDVEERVQNAIKRLLKDPQLRQILRYPNATVCGDHYVLPVAVNHRHKIPGVVHRTSSTGETLFIEPTGVATLSAERAVLKSEEDREIRRILRRLSGEVAKVAKPLSFAIDILAKLDLITAKAKYSRAFNMAAPDMNTSGQLWLRQARHPLLEHLFQMGNAEWGMRNEKRREQERPESSSSSAQSPSPSASDPQSPFPTPHSTDSLPHPRNAPKEERHVVPIDIRLGYGFNLLIITGPNTGGKTVCLKTAGLLSLMALSGMHIPAGQGSNVPLFSNILADIGDEQSLEQSLSTFSSHITRIGHILRTANTHSLVLLDELGAGTDPTEGAALGRAILDQLDRIGCRAMVTTHLGDLKTYAFNNDRAENGAVAFDIETLRPTYKLEIGQFGMSNALKIAKRLKLPRDLLRRAHRYLRRRQKRAPELIQLQRLREEAEKAREEALAAAHKAEREADELRRKQAELDRQAEEAQSLREARLRLVSGDRVRVPRYDKVGKVVRTDFKKNVVVVNLGLGQWEVALDEVFPMAD